MDLDKTELSQLATFFAKRLTPDLERVDPTDPPAPGDPGADWRHRLERSQANGTLPELARKIAAADPSDQTLQDACALLASERRGMEDLALGAVIAGGAAVALAAVTATGLFLGWAGLQGAPDLADARERTERSITVERPSPSVAEVPAEVALQPQSLAEEPDAELARAADDGIAAVDEATLTAVEPGAEAPSRCTRANGGLVGYWYAGSQAPGRAGDAVVVPRAVNVRADYPDAHNDFDARAAVRCVLEAGDTVRLSADPILVPGGRYWVPLTSGDLTASADRPNG